MECHICYANHTVQDVIAVQYACVVEAVGWACVGGFDYACAAGPQSAFGYQLAHAAMASGSPSQPALAHLALSAGIGKDIPKEALQWFQEMNVASTGLQQRHDGTATPRAWQLFEQDGLRTQVWRSRYSDTSLPDELLRPDFGSMPSELHCSKAYHLGVNPNSFSLELLEQLRTSTDNGKGACLETHVHLKSLEHVYA